MSGPQTIFSDKLHGTKYRGAGESFRESIGRNASAQCDSPEHYEAYREITMAMRFLGAGRVQTAMGSMQNVCAHNCFVSGIVEDSFVDGTGSIMHRAHEEAATLRQGGGLGFDLSTLRPRGEAIKKLGRAMASGPVSFMDIYDAICRCTASAGHRRGALMGVLRVDHPDIERFVHAKQPGPEAQPILDLLSNMDPASPEFALWNDTLQSVLKFTGFNTSIAITDEFMEAVAHDRPFTLKWGGRDYEEVNAVALWEMIMRSTWDWAEPGVLFIDTINRMNNLWYCETITATNPCGEQPLPPYGACLLGSINLPAYILQNKNDTCQFDYDQLKADMPHIIRAMDNVVDAARYPLYEQEKEAKAKRRMGIGVTGLANAVEALLGRASYGDPHFIELQDKIQSMVTHEAYRASIELAKEKGSFPMFDRNKYCQGQFIMSLPQDIQEGIRKYGIRNSHLTSYAPTGTISFTADNVSSGVEPVFSYLMDRKLQTFDGPEIVSVEDYGHRVFQIKGRTQDQVTMQQHLDVLLTSTRNVDSAVSKTCNVPADTPWADFKNIYMSAWKGGAKGCTTFQVGGKRAGIFKSTPPQKDEDGGQACYIDEYGRKECE